MERQKPAGITQGMEAAIVTICSVLYFAVAFVVAGSKLLWYDDPPAKPLP